MSGIMSQKDIIMQTNEIFGQVSNRMIEGLMTHSQLADYFGFIGLEGFQHCHLYHFFEENCNYKKIAQYYLKHYSKILIEKPFKNHNIISVFSHLSEYPCSLLRYSLYPIVLSLLFLHRLAPIRIYWGHLLRFPFLR